MAMITVRNKHPLLKLLKMILRLFYPRHAIAGMENVLPDLPAAYICNHLETYSPIVLSLYFPFPYRPWVHASVMTRELCRDYLEKDFTRKTLKLHPPFSRWLAAILAPLCIGLMRSIDAIPVYRGQMKVRDTFAISVQALKQGNNLLIFPEKQSLRTSETVSEFHTGFISLARYYLQATGKTLRFYPVHISSKEKIITIGKAIEYIPAKNFYSEKARITAELQKAINEIAIRNGGSK